MKQFLKKNWPWLAPCIIIPAAVIFLYCQGFRITYAPELETSWDAVSAFASWSSVLVSVAAVIVSGFAIWFAIQVPKKIADRQDKIALFTKRLDVYQTLKRCQSFGGHVQNMDTLNMVRIYFLTCFSNERISCSNFHVVQDLCREPLLNAVNSLQSGVFIFDFDTKTVIEPLVKSLEGLIVGCASEENYQEIRGNYLKAVSKLDEQFMAQIEEALMLRK